MPRLFGLDIDRLVYDGIQEAGGLTDGYVIRMVDGERDPNNLSGGRSKTPFNYTAEGFFEDYDNDEIDGTLVKVGFRRALVLALSLPEGFTPRVGDEVQFETERGRVTRLERDPAAATYTLHCGVTDTTVFTQLTPSNVVFVNDTNLTLEDVQNLIDAANSQNGGSSGGGSDIDLPIPDLIDDQSNPLIFFFGWEFSGSDWLIYRQDRSTSDTVAANISNNPERANLSEAWPNRANLTYTAT